MLPDGTGDAPSIQAAIDAAAPRDVIQLAYGTFTGPGNRDLDLAGKTLTIRSLGGEAQACIIDCQGSAADPHRGFDFHTQEDADTRLEHITVRGGWAEGDDVFNDGTGGALRIVGGAAPTLIGVVLRDNTAMSGGAVWVHDAAPTFDRCVFSDNTAWWGSGGALNLYAATLTEPIADCVFRGNASHQTGGAVASASSEFRLERCLFAANRVNAGGGGGGLECFTSTVCEVVDCTFADNVAVGGGGGAYVWGGAECTFERCTFAGNSADDGSGIGVDQGTATVLSSIIAFGDGPSVGVQGDPTPSISCTDIFGNAGGDWVDAIADQAGTRGNVATDPLFCGDDLPETPYALHADSPCAPGHYPCLQMGAWPVGCAAATAVGPTLPGPVVLREVAPNPFNPRTTVRFALARQMRVEVAVHDVRGGRVAILANGIHEAGETTVDWDGRDAAGRDMPSGTYLVHLSTAAGVQTRKAVLVR